MKAIKLVAMDLDGTLLGADKRVSPRNARALRLCEEKGLDMVLASGRSFESVAVMAREIGLNSPIISSNGTRVDLSPAGESILNDFFPRELAERVFAILIESRVYFVCYGRGVMYQNNLRYHPEEQRGLNQMMRIGNETQNGCHIDIYRDERTTFEKGLTNPLKFIAFCKDAGALSALRERLQRETDCAINSSWYDNVEIMVHGAGKGRAVRALAERRGLDREEIMAFGDNLNDLEMLGAAGWPVAMENATPEIKAAARLIAPHHDQSGVGRVLEEYVLGEGKTP